jgi:hypothetical protein
MSSFLEPLILKDNDSDKFTLMESFSYSIGCLDSDIIITVPKGFVTDFGSIPGFLWFVLPKLGKYNKAAVVHDYLYQMVREKRFSRVVADSIFLEAMGVLEVPKWKRFVVYLGVRLFGWIFV